MIVRYYGHSCFSATLQSGATLVFDPFDDSVGYPLCRARADAALLSHDHFDHNHVASLTGTPRSFTSPGKWDFMDARITGIKCWHDDVRGAKRGSNLIFKVEADGQKLAHLGDLGHLPSDELYGELSGLDAMLIPVGGTYTITAEQAAEIVSRTKPRIAIAMHFKTPYIDFPITGIDSFSALTGAEALPGEIDLADPGLPRVGYMSLYQ